MVLCVWEGSFVLLKFCSLPLATSSIRLSAYPTLSLGFFNALLPRVWRCCASTHTPGLIREKVSRFWAIPSQSTGQTHTLAALLPSESRGWVEITVWGTLWRLQTVREQRCRVLMVRRNFDRPKRVHRWPHIHPSSFKVSILRTLSGMEKLMYDYPPNQVSSAFETSLPQKPSLRNFHPFQSSIFSLNVDQVERGISSWLLLQWVPCISVIRSPMLSPNQMEPSST